jgi:hypothetical protein
VIWIKQRDNNSKFFHQYVNYRKNVNTIWEIEKSDGTMVHSFKDKAEEGARHFFNQFQKPVGCLIQEILEVISKFDPVFSKEMNRSLSKEVSKSKVHDALFSMQKGKSPGPDGLTTEFYINFYELIKEDLLKMVRESQRSEKMLGSFNSTFIALIPKKQDGKSFGDYRSISCCNVIYKIVAKVMARRLNPILNEVISKEQFGFLRNRQIHDAVVVAQEALQSIKTSN